MSTVAHVRGPVRPPGQEDLDAVVARFLAQLDRTEALARAADPRAGRFYGWAPWSVETGLDRAQEDFVDAWSPRRILDHCHSQRELALHLQEWVRTHLDDIDLALVVLRLTAP